jgi:hypothetical protein
LGGLSHRAQRSTLPDVPPETRVLHISLRISNNRRAAFRVPSSEVKGMKAMVERQIDGQALCPICTHTVPAHVDMVKGKFPRVAPGQKCPRCSASLDVAVVVRVPEAA